MDRQAWIAVTLCIIGLIAWQVYMAKHPAPVPAKISASPSPAPGVGQDSVEPGATVATSLPSPAPGSTESRPTSAATPPNEATPTPAPFVEKTTTLRNADLELLLTNRGGGIAEAILPKHKGENGGPVKLNVRQRLPIGAIIEKPATPVLEEFSIVPGQDIVQFERALPNNVALRKKFSLPAPPNEKDNYVAQMEFDFQNSGAAVYSNPGYFVALGSAAPIHRNDLPNYTRLTWCINGKTKSTDVSWFGRTKLSVLRGPETRRAGVLRRKGRRRGMGGGEQPIFRRRSSRRLAAKATEVWAQRFEARKKNEGQPEYGIEGAMGMPGFQVQPGQTATVQFQLYLGPKLYHRLAQLTHDEAEIMDFRDLEAGQRGAAQHDEPDPSVRRQLRGRDSRS